MPIVESTPTGAPIWIELFTSDLEGAKAFYGDLFGWTADTANADFGGYVNFRKGDDMVAGCMANDGSGGMPDTWTVYLASDDAEKTTEVATTHGGQVHLPAMDVGDLGRMAMVADSGGAAVGVWQPGEHRGMAVRDEPGTAGWFELHTRDYDRAVAFYRDVFGWDAHVAADEPGFRYTTLGEGDQALGGIMDATDFLPEGVPAHWSVYFRVSDTDAALAKVVALGGTVLEPAVDTPYGRMAAVADPTGTRFKLVA